jgi:hypothetical protein
LMPIPMIKKAKNILFISARYCNEFKVRTKTTTKK